MRQERRKLLMDSAIQVVAQDGLEKTTTKRIASEVGLNEVNIYRCFQDKEDLLKQVFLYEDRAFIREVISRLDILKNEETDLESRCREIWEGCWNYMMQRPDHCLFYVRYYHSALYDEEIRLEHRKNCAELFGLCVDAELSGRTGVHRVPENVLLYMLEMAWSFAAKAVQGIWPNTPDTSELCFQLIYALYRNVAKTGAFTSEIYEKEEQVIYE